MPQAKKKVSKKKTAKKAVSKKATSKKAASKKAVSKKKVSAKKAAAKKTTRKVAKKAAKATAKKAVKKTAAKSTANNSGSKKPVPKKPVAKKAVTKKPVAKKAVTKKAVAKKVAPKRKPAKQVNRAATEAALKISTETMLVEGFVPYQPTKTEEFMNPKQIEHFRNLLNLWKKELMQEVERTVHHMQDEAANFPDPNDRATQESEFSLELRNRDRERKLIKKIDEAYASLTSGEYGYCETCGIEIGIRRLEARPTATQCIDCKELSEIKERQFG